MVRRRGTRSGRERGRRTDLIGSPPRDVLHARLQATVAELKRMGGLPSAIEAEGIWDDIWAVEAHHSTALEGNTLLMRQVEALLLEDRAVGSKELREYLEVKGYAIAARWVYGQARDPNGPWSDGSLVTISEIRHVHELSMGLVWQVAPHEAATPEESPGNFRRHDIERFRGGMTPPGWTEVHSRVTDWVRQVCATDENAERIMEHVADLHAAFERVHPFIDGNGRVGRLVTNLVLVRLGYPPAIVFKRDRRRYLQGLRLADQGKPGVLGDLFTRAVLVNLYRFVLPAVAGPVKLVPLAALTTEDLTHRALRAAAARGRLRAVRDEDGQWRSSKRWVEEYARSRYRREALDAEPGLSTGIE